MARVSAQQGAAGLNRDANRHQSAGVRILRLKPAVGLAAGHRPGGVGGYVVASDVPDAPAADFDGNQAMRRPPGGVACRRDGQGVPKSCAEFGRPSCGGGGTDDDLVDVDIAGLIDGDAGRAADRLGVTRSAVSQTIRKLEAAIGVALVRPPPAAPVLPKPAIACWPGPASASGCSRASSRISSAATSCRCRSSICSAGAANQISFD